MDYARTASSLIKNQYQCLTIDFLLIDQIFNLLYFLLNSASSFSDVYLFSFTMTSLSSPLMSDPNNEPFHKKNEINCFP